MPRDFAGFSRTPCRPGALASWNGGRKTLLRMPTSALLERVEQHINRLDQALKDSENLLNSLKRGDRDDWIRDLQERLTDPSQPDAQDDIAWTAPAEPYYSS
jgi:hypothetical protein